MTVEDQTYTNDPELVDWDAGIDEWKEEVMGQWPFGNPRPEDQRILGEALDCLDFLDSHLEYEEWVICLLYTSPSPRDATLSRMPSSA